MMKVYTPQQWLSLFGGSPGLIIDDKGYIYSADGYYKLISDSPIGRIDFEKGYIYDKHYVDLFPTPIAYMADDNGVIKVREYGKSLFSDPILYIQNDKIYTPEEYLRLFGGNPSGYIRRDPPSGGGNTSGGGNSSGGEPSSGGGAPMPGCAGILGVGLIAGIIYLLSSEARVASVAMIVAIAVNVCAVVYFLWKASRGELHFEWNSKRLGKAVATGIGIYIGATAVLVLLGLVSNMGTGHAISDEGGNQLELAAIFIGLPFVLGGFFAEGPKPGAAKKSNSAPTSYTPPAPQPTPAPKATPKSTPRPAESKIAVCPRCGAKCRVPAGNGMIRITCPNPNCKTPFTFDS